MSKLKLDIEKIDKVHLIKPNGLIDIITSPELDNCIEKLVNHENYNIIVDMSATKYISSAGWGIFIGSLRKIKENNGDIVFIKMKEEIKDFFKTLHLPSKFKCFNSREQAIEYFNKL